MFENAAADNIFSPALQTLGREFNTVAAAAAAAADTVEYLTIMAMAVPTKRMDQLNSPAKLIQNDMLPA